MTPCSRCRRDFSQETWEKPTASISGGIMEDEYAESYYFCRDCGVYAVAVVHDRFLGEETAFSRVIAEVGGDVRIELIRQCPEPWNKKCRCPAHRTYFGDALD